MKLHLLILNLVPYLTLIKPINSLELQSSSSPPTTDNIFQRQGRIFIPEEDHNISAVPFLPIRNSTKRGTSLSGFQQRQIQGHQNNNANKNQSAISPNLDGRRILIYVHGTLGLLAWTLFLPLGIFMARYFKQTFTTVYICGRSLWFISHTGMMSISLIVIAVSTTFLHLWVEGLKLRTFHGISGIILLGWMGLIQPVLGCVIVTLNHKRSLNLFPNKVHGLMGHFMFLVGIVTVCSSRNLGQGGLPCNSKTTIIIWVFLYFLVHIIMSYQTCYSDFLSGRQVSRVYTVGTLEPSSAPVGSEYEDTNEHPEMEEPGASGRKVTLGVFTFLCALFTFILLVQLWMTFPIDRSEGDCHVPKSNATIKKSRSSW